MLWRPHDGRQFCERQCGVCPLLGNLAAGPGCRQARLGSGSGCVYGVQRHLRKLTAITGPMKALRLSGPFPSETALYRNFGLSFIQPELREGHDEVERAAKNTLPVLVSLNDIRGELHAHSTSSDGANSIEQMAIAAQNKGYEYIGITDHSQS